ncbi:MAG TPA: GNAT family N-acetyltransferase [Steroidobacteraceae bacterium]|nr:GNAT family N-acetyltransferase [Steroidobacteraceae bacterium]
MTSGMQVVLTESRDQVPLDRERWNALASANPVSTAFQTYEWFDSWWTAFGGQHRLHFLTLHDGGEIVGFAPLMRTRGPLGLRQIEFTGTPNADYQDLVVPAHRADAIDALCRFLHAGRRSWDMVVLRQIPADSPTIPDMRAACARAGLGLLEGERQPCPGLLLHGQEDPLNQMLDRYSIRRAIRKLERHGPLSLRTADEPGEIERLLPQFFEQHVRRWQSTDSPSPFTHEAYRRWYRELAHAASAEGWLHFSVLRCGETPVAFHFGFCHGDTLSWYKPSFEPDFARDSPGTALVCRLVEEAGRRGLRVLDFSAGREPFKARFSNVERECLNLRIFARPLLHSLFRAGAGARRLLRDHWHGLRARRRGRPAQD